MGLTEYHSQIQQNREMHSRPTQGNGKEGSFEERMRERKAIATFDVIQAVFRKLIDPEETPHKLVKVYTEDGSGSTEFWLPDRKEGDPNFSNGRLALINTNRGPRLTSQLFWYRIPRRLDKYTIFPEDEKIILLRELTDQGTWEYTYQNVDKYQGKVAIDFMFHLSTILSATYAIRVDPHTGLVKSH